MINRESQHHFKKIEHFHQNHLLHNSIFHPRTLGRLKNLSLFEKNLITLMAFLLILESVHAQELEQDSTHSTNALKKKNPVVAPPLTEVFTNLHTNKNTQPTIHSKTRDSALEKFKQSITAFKPDIQKDLHNFIKYIQRRYADCSENIKVVISIDVSRAQFEQLPLFREIEGIVKTKEQRFIQLYQERIIALSTSMSPQFTQSRAHLRLLRDEDIRLNHALIQLQQEIIKLFFPLEHRASLTHLKLAWNEILNLYEPQSQQKITRLFDKLKLVLFHQQKIMIDDFINHNQDFLHPEQKQLGLDVSNIINFWKQEATHDELSAIEHVEQEYPEVEKPISIIIELSITLINHAFERLNISLLEEFTSLLNHHKPIFSFELVQKQIRTSGRLAFFGDMELYWYQELIEEEIDHQVSLIKKRLPKFFDLKQYPSLYHPISKKRDFEIPNEHYALTQIDHQKNEDALYVKKPNQGKIPNFFDSSWIKTILIIICFFIGLVTLYPQKAGKTLRPPTKNKTPRQHRNLHHHFSRSNQEYAPAFFVPNQHHPLHHLSSKNAITDPLVIAQHELDEDYAAYRDALASAKQVRKKCRNFVDTKSNGRKNILGRGIDELNQYLDQDQTQALVQEFLECKQSATLSAVLSLKTKLGMKTKLICSINRRMAVFMEQSDKKNRSKIQL